MSKSFRRVLKVIVSLFFCLTPYYFEREKDGSFTASAVLYRLKYRKAKCVADAPSAVEPTASPVQDEEFAAEDEFDDRDSYTINFFGLFRDQWNCCKQFHTWLRNSRK